jgi:hypothetical protein
MVDSSIRGESRAEDPAGDEVVEVVLAWRDAASATVLAVRQVREGESAALGELGELLVPREILGKCRFVVATHSGDVATAFVPAGAVLLVAGEPVEAREIELVLGRVVELEIGPFEVRLARVKAERRPASAPLESLRRSGAGYFAGSAIVHAAAFAAVAFYASTLGATEEFESDDERIAWIQHLLDASAAREAEATPEPGEAPAADDRWGAPAALGAAGAAGNRDSVRRDARRAVRGDAPRDDPARTVRQALDEAAFVGSLGGAAIRHVDGPSAWARDVGSEAVDADGVLFADRIGDAFGAGGFGPFGPGQGGSGTADIIGVPGIAGLGGLGTCSGDVPCDGAPGGHGFGRDPSHSGHVSHFKGPRYAEPVVNGGHLPPEIIQRIVRQNDGRYRLCYQLGLRGNPNLSGRVTVKFAIDRTGAVAMASDGGSDLADADVRSCVVRAFANLSFPAPENGTLFVSYPIVFSPE